MKKIALTILCILFLNMTQAQQAINKEKSNTELFNEKSGKLIQREFINVGVLKKMRIMIFALKDLIDNSSSSALRLEYDSYSSLGSDTKIAILDKDEVDGLIKSLRIIQEKIFPTSPENYTEVTFKSRGGFEAGCFQDAKKKWSVYLKLERFDGKSTVYMESSDMTELISLIEQVKLKL